MQYNLQVGCVTLWQMRLVVFVKSELKTKISHVQTSSVATVCVYVYVCMCLCMCVCVYVCFYVCVLHVCAC